jgi:hypothetical protein
MNRQLPIVMAAQKDPALESPNDADIELLPKVVDRGDGMKKAAYPSA